MNQNLMGIMKNLILYPQGRPSPPPLGAEAKVAMSIELDLLRLKRTLIKSFDIGQRLVAGKSRVSNRQ
jgi:hypothetical protein